MIDTTSSPPRWAEAFLRTLLRPDDVESIPGDLLEEYREVRRPSLGAFRADVWYIKHIVSVLWRAVWPAVVAIAALRVFSPSVYATWNPSLLPAPGVSFLDALICLCAGYYASHRTGRLVTGIVTSGVTSLAGFLLFVVYGVLTVPGVLRASIERPFIFVILSIYLAMAVGFGMVTGMVGAVFGRWLLPPGTQRARLT